MKVLGLGDNAVDEYMHIRTTYPGGNVLSFVVYARVLGMEAGYLGVFGDDKAATCIHDTIRGLGPELSHCCFCPGEDGYAEVRLDNGDKVFIGSNRGGVSGEHPLELIAMGRAYIAGYNIVHTSIFSYIEDELPLIRQVSSFVSTDFSDRTDEEYLKRYTPHVNCASAPRSNMPRSEIEKQMVLVRRFGCRHIVIATGGAKEALVMVDGRLCKQLPYSVKAVDITGTGDSFITCFLVNYVDAMKGSKDFLPIPGTKGTVIVADYQDLAVRTSLYHAAIYSADNYQKEGSFGFNEVLQYE